MCPRHQALPPNDLCLCVCGQRNFSIASLRRLRLLRSLSKNCYIQDGYLPPKPLSKPVLLCLSCTFSCFHVKFECNVILLTPVNSPHMELAMFQRIFRRKQRDKRVVWGIRSPETVKTRWLMLAAIMRVPANRLILFVLNDWVQKNADTLTDEVTRNRLADRITEAYLKRNLS